MSVLEVSHIMNTLKRSFASFAAIALLSLAAWSQTSLTSIDGSTVDVQGQKGKVVVLAIGASWLPLSDKQVEYTNMLAKKYAGRNVVFYFIATDSNTARSKNFATNAALEKFRSAAKLAVPILRDPDGAATLKKFGVDQIPSFVILDKSGGRVGEPFGGIDPKYDVTVPISKAIDKLL